MRDPRSGRVIPEAGLVVEDGDLFWLRRLRDGDVETVEEPVSGT